MSSIPPIFAKLNLAELESMTAKELLRFAFINFGARAAIGTSLQKTGIILVDLVAQLGLDFRVFFIDTQLNHPETYELLEQVEERYTITVERFQAAPKDIELLYRSVGQYAHFMARSLCCHTRKVLPLGKAQDSMDVWISGLRTDQSEHRQNNSAKARIETAHDGRKLLKLNPLLDWSEAQVDQYTLEHKLPTNRLYDYVSSYGERYFVIGCQPCHIPVRREFGLRAGKFPWEQGHKECGLHERGSGI